MSDRSLLRRFLISPLLIGLLVATVYWSVNSWIVCLIVCEGIVLLGLKEMTGLLRAKGVKVFEFYTLAGGAALTAAIFFSSFPRNLSGDIVFSVLYGWCIGLFFLTALRRSTEGAIATLLLSVGSLLYVAGLFGFLIKINFMEGIDGRLFVFYIFLAVYLADIAAYAVGSTVGRRPLAPTISPKKTLEGALGAFLGACAGSLIAQRLFLPQLAVLHAVALGALIGIVSQIGDLWESLLKRDAGVKDSGNSIPGMGGVLDLLDGLLFCAPLVYLYMKIVLRL